MSENEVAFLPHPIPGGAEMHKLWCLINQKQLNVRAIGFVDVEPCLRHDHENASLTTRTSAWQGAEFRVCLVTEVVNCTWSFSGS